MAKKLSVVFGIIFILVGVLGFIPNPLVGNGAIFDADLVHSLVHLVIGLVLLIVGLKCAVKSSLALIVVGIVYLLVAVIGLFGAENVLGFIHVNGADNWLHLVLGIVILVAGIATKGGSSAPVAPMTPGQPQM